MKLIRLVPLIHYSYSYTCNLVTLIVEVCIKLLLCSCYPTVIGLRKYEVHYSQ